MWPILFTIGTLPIYSYGLSVAIAVLLCTWLLSKDAAKYDIKPDAIQDLVFILVLSGILGARLFYVSLDWAYYKENLWHIVLLNEGGLSWQGGLIAALGAGFLYLKIKKWPMRLTLDLLAPYIALGQAIGRLGCFANGCCYGKPVIWGIYFPVHGARLHPTQLYEFASLLLIFFILKSIGHKKENAGFVFLMYIWLSSIERFVVEFYRADQMAVWGPLSLFQWISLGVGVGGLIVLMLGRKNNHE